MQGFVLLAQLAASQSSFYVYRAESSKSPYHWHLLNSNAANEAGVLSYIHTEVIPQDMGSCTPPGCVRKFDIDVIMRFHITMKNPAGYPTPPLGNFKAFDGGKCTVQGCQDEFDRAGYFIGSQDQAGNTLHGYRKGVWYSFPGGGLCGTPDGSHNCTYVARPAGQLLLNDLVNSQGEIIAPTFSDWCRRGGVEFARKGRIAPDACVATKSIPFWDGVCDEAACTSRVSTLSNTVGGGLWNVQLDNGCTFDPAVLAVFSSSGTCVPTCPAGTRPDWAYNCQPCGLDHCKQCTWPSGPNSKSTLCTECDLESFLESNVCVSSCQPHHYPDSLQKKCVSCDSSCGECSGPKRTECKSCDAPLLFFAEQRTCVSTCPAGSYGDQQNHVCATCSPACGNCSGGLDSQCTSCKPDHPFLDQGRCALECGAHKTFSGEGEDAKVCFPCHPTCDSCQGKAGHCTSCYEGEGETAKAPFLWNHTCLSTCPSQHFPDTPHTCQACSPHCLECAGPGPSDCRACSPTGEKPFLQNSTCQEACASANFPDSKNICQPCNPTCLECSSATTCTKCPQQGTPYLDKGVCLSACPKNARVGPGNVCETGKSNYTWVGVVAGVLVVLAGAGAVIYIRRKRPTDSTPLLDRT